MTAYLLPSFLSGHVPSVMKQLEVFGYFLYITITKRKGKGHFNQLTSRNTFEGQCVESCLKLLPCVCETYIV